MQLDEKRLEGLKAIVATIMSVTGKSPTIDTGSLLSSEFARLEENQLIILISFPQEKSSK